MNSEVLPVGTERLLNRLGYWLNSMRTAWGPDEAYDVPPDRLSRVAAARMSDISPEQTKSVDKVMTAVQIKYRRTQAWFMHKDKGFLTVESEMSEENEVVENAKEAIEEVAELDSTPDAAADGTDEAPEIVEQAVGEEAAEPESRKQECQRTAALNAGEKTARKQQ
jgi:hypothetical protein